MVIILSVEEVCSRYKKLINKDEEKLLILQSIGIIVMK